MEKKKITKKTVKKQTKTATKKAVTKKPSVKKKKGFTLIELLAVIIILGILMIIAIPSVTKYISDSRKSAYVDTAKEIVGATRNLVNEGKLGMYDTNTTYYIPVDYIKTENASKSPYGKFTQAYVGVAYDGKGYKYYWISTDDAGQGVDKLTLADDLETDDIKSDLIADNIEETVKTTGVGSRTNILILQDGQWGSPFHADNHVGEDGGIVVYPAGKTKETVATGDIVTIGPDEFYVIKHDGNNLVLLAKYDLKVGTDYTSFSLEEIKEYTPADSGYGMQNSEAGQSNNNTLYSYTHFSNSAYWDNNGTLKSEYIGSYWPDAPQYPYVYGSGSIIKEYVDYYKNYLTGLGANIKEARLLKYEEAEELGCDGANWTCADAPAFLTSVDFWTGSASMEDCVWYIVRYNKSLDFEEYDYGPASGVRPVIVI